MIAGGLAGLCQTVVTTPMELLKIQLQLSAQKSVGRSTSALTLATNLLSSQGKILLILINLILYVLLFMSTLTIKFFI